VYLSGSVDRCPKLTGAIDEAHKIGSDAGAALVARAGPDFLASLR
jgi:hypothetical protein